MKAGQSFHRIAMTVPRGTGALQHFSVNRGEGFGIEVDIVSVRAIMFIKNVAFHVLKGLSALTSVPSASQDNEKPAFDLGSEPYLPKPCPDANILNPLRIS